MRKSFKTGVENTSYSGKSKGGRKLHIAFDDSYRFANPDLVHPFNRRNYPGYAIRKEKKTERP